jgi:hypothetical protein
VRSRWDGGWECVRQTWCARDASWGWSAWVVVMGRLHISQKVSACESGVVCSGSVGASGSSAGAGNVASVVGGADCVVRGGGDKSLDVGVLGDVVDFDCFITMDRYVSAMLAPEVAEEAGVVVVSRSEERTNLTRLRRMPEVKGRWCSGGRT